MFLLSLCQDRAILIFFYFANLTSYNAFRKCSYAVARDLNFSSSYSLIRFEPLSICALCHNHKTNFY